MTQLYGNNICKVISPMMYLGVLMVLLLYDGVQGVEVDTVKSVASLVGRKVKQGASNSFYKGMTWTDDVLKNMGSSVVTTYCSFVVATLMGCLKLIPNTATIPPLDVKLAMGGPGHLSADEGQIRGMSSVKVRPIVFDRGNHGDIVFTFPLTFTDLHVTYGRFQFESWPLIMSGAADLKFTDSEVNMNIRLSKPKDFLRKFATGNCIFHIESIKLSGFEKMEPNITLDGFQDHKFLADHVFPVMAKSIKQVMLQTVNVRVTNSLHNYLPSSGSWVCRNPALKPLQPQTSGPVTLTPSAISKWKLDSNQDGNANQGSRENTKNNQGETDSDIKNFHSAKKKTDTLSNQNSDPDLKDLNQNDEHDTPELEQNSDSESREFHKKMREVFGFKENSDSDTVVFLEKLLSIDNEKDFEAALKPHADAIDLLEKLLFSDNEEDFEAVFKPLVNKF